METESDVATQAVRGSFFNMGSSVVTVVLGFVRSIVLARLLLPEDFGSVGLATFFASVVGQVTDFGFQQALIHRNDRLREATSTYFVLKVGSAVVAVLLALLLAPLLNRLYPSYPQMARVLIVLSLVRVVRAANSAPDVLMQKELTVRYLAGLAVASSLAMTIVAPAMAWFGFGFWSLVGEQAVPVLARALGLWVIRRPWRVSFRFDADMARWYFRFGTFVYLSVNLDFLLDQFDDFWTGTTLGATALGFYSRAYEFARYTRRVVGSPITRVFFPAYARLQHSRSRLSSAYRRASGLIVRLGFLFGLVFMFVVPEFVHIFIGIKWLPMVFTFRLMILYTLLDPLVVTSGHLLTAIGKPQILARVKLLQFLVFVPAVIVLAYYFGINGVAVAADLMLVTGLVLLLVHVRRSADFSLWRLFGYPFLGLLVAGSCTLLISQYLPPGAHWLALVSKGGVAFVLYVGVLFAFERNEYRRSLETLLDFVKTGAE